MLKAEEIRCTINSSSISRTLSSWLTKGSNPTLSYEMVVSAGHNDETAKLAYWLNAPKQDYTDHCDKIIQKILGHVQTNTAKKGERNEKSICS